VVTRIQELSLVSVATSDSSLEVMPGLPVLDSEPHGLQVSTETVSG